jgi:vacuolar-type H+-ATPase subunit I/STV1
LANYRLIDGKTTLERLQEEWQKLVDLKESITVTEFARRTGISYHTLTHQHKDWAEKVRRLRDEGRTKPRKKSPASLSREQIAELEQASEVIAKLRSRVEDLTRKLNAFSEEEGDRRKLVEQNQQLKEVNERLRGVIISVQQEIVRYAPPELGNRLIALIQEHATGVSVSNA